MEFCLPQKNGKTNGKKKQKEAKNKKKRDFKKLLSFSGCRNTLALNHVEATNVVHMRLQTRLNLTSILWTICVG